LREEFVRLAPESPTGQKRILSIEHPLVYRIRVSSHRGATWVDEHVVDTDERVIVWLCAAHGREAGSDDDAYVYFAELHSSDELLPDSDDRLRDRAEAAIRLYRGLSADLILLLDAALAERGTERWCRLSEVEARRRLEKVDQERLQTFESVVVRPPTTRRTGGRYSSRRG
jgi:hypothetical protein